MYNHTWACIVLPVNIFSSASLILIYGWLLPFVNGAPTGVVAGIAVVYTGME